METVYLGMGGNLQNPYASIKKALRLIEDIENVSLVNTSSFYQTSPVSKIEQEDYLNAVCSIKTTLTPFQLLEKLKEIERVIGKTPKGKEEPRIIDIDILFFGKKNIDTKDLTVPHPRWKERLFVLVPLAEITSTIELSDGILDLDELIKHFPFKKDQKISIFKLKDQYENSLCS